MTIIDQLINDIKSAIAKFLTSHTKISRELNKKIIEIDSVVRNNNPVNLVQALVSHVDSFSTGFIAIWPFLEVNKLKNIIKEILVLPKYQENVILKSIIFEMNTDPASSNLHILNRLEKLEGAYSLQNFSIKNMGEEIKSLTAENQFLTKTLSMLAEKNKTLSLENEVFKSEKQGLEQEASKLKLERQTLIDENKLLKNKISHLESQRLLENKEEKPVLSKINSETNEPIQSISHKVLL